MSHKTLIELNLNILQDYQQMEELNSKNWDIISHLNIKYDINAAISFSKLYFPDFILRKGCVILGFLYDEDVFDKWYEKYNGNISSVESMCNSYDIMDFFGLNRAPEESLEDYNLLIDEFAKILKTSWEINCKLLFPEKELIIEVYDQYDTTRVTVYTQP